MVSLGAEPSFGFSFITVGTTFIRWRERCWRIATTPTPPLKRRGSDCALSEQSFLMFVLPAMLRT